MIKQFLVATSFAVFALFTGDAAEAGPRAVNACGTISQPGSYILTRNLNGTAAAGDCIEINASHVTLDLDGFSIGEPGIIGGIPGGHGVHVLCCNNHNVTVRNGAVTGWVSGVVGDNSVTGMRVEAIRAIDNDGVGVHSLGDGAMIIDNYTIGSGNDGVLFGEGATVMRNISNGNGDDGLHGTCDAVVMFNTAVGNTNVGYQITNSATSPTCVVDQNAG